MKTVRESYAPLIRKGLKIHRMPALAGENGADASWSYLNFDGDDELNGS